MLVSNDAVLVATSIVLAVSTIVSLTVQLERQYKTVGALNASKCEHGLHQEADLILTRYFAGFLVASGVCLEVVS